MTIYTSEKVVPYVYMGIHRVTGEFYIGSRTSKQQKLPSHEDIHQYRTSSKDVKPIFDEFDWVIIAEFFDPISAYTFEHELIYENWNNPLKLNRVCYHGKATFGRHGVKLSDETKQRMSEARRKRPGKPLSEEHKQHIREASAKRVLTDDARRRMSESSKKRVGIPRTEATKVKLSNARKGVPRVPHSEEAKAKMSVARQSRTTEYKHSPETREKLQAVYDSRRGKKQSPETIQKKKEARARYLEQKAKAT